MNPKKITKWLTAAALAGLLTTSCLGPSPATGRLFQWNHSIDGKWGNEGAFILLLPVYAVFSVGDLLIFNSWYWWTGEYLIDPPKAKVPIEFGV